MERHDAIVIGGGLVGCLVARELAASGHSVLLLERGAELGKEASSAAAGMLSPQMESADGLLVEGEEQSADGAHSAMMALCLAARSGYRRFADELADETNRDLHYRGDGTLVVTIDPAEARRLEATAQAQSARGLRAEYLDGADARGMEPAIAAHAVGALHLPDDHQIDTLALMEAAAAAAGASQGVTVATGCTVERILARKGRVSGVEADGRRISSACVVLAAGAWSGTLEGLPRSLPVRPVKGQMASVRPSRTLIRRTVGGSGAYCVPRDDGRILIGATVERAGYDASVSEAEIAGLLSAAQRFLPGLAELPVVSRWAGLRPGTPDSLPIIGEDPDLAGLIYATGHYRNGILLAPLTAGCVAALVSDKPPPTDLQSFAPDRDSLQPETNSTSTY